MAFLPNERKAKAAALKDSRPPVQRLVSAQRLPVPVAPPSKLDQEIAALEKQKYEAKRAKMSPSERQLATLQEMRDREEVAAGKPHPRIAQIEAIIDRILMTEGREFLHYENALLCLQQHGGEGLCQDTANRMWDELLAQEQAYADSVETSINERRSALEAELAQLQSNRAALPTTANQYRTLLAAAVGPKAIPFPSGSEGYDDEIRRAEGVPEAESAVVAKYSAQIREYQEGQS